MNTLQILKDLRILPVFFPVPSGPVADSPPVNISAPVITSNGDLANPVVGDVLTITPGIWSGHPSPTLTHQWKYGDNSDITSATALTYTVASGDASKTIHVTEIATNTSDTVSANSNASGTVTSGPTQLDPVTSLAASDNGLEQLQITWTDPASVPNGLLLVVTRDAVEVVRTTLADGASQPYLVSGTGTYAGSIVNKGDGTTNSDSTTASFSGVTVAGVAAKRPNEISGLDQWFDPDQDTNSPGVVTSLHDFAGNSHIAQPDGGNVGDVTLTTGGPNGHLYYAFPNGIKWWAAVTSSASARTRIIALNLASEISGSWFFWSNGGDWQTDAIIGNTTGNRPGDWGMDRTARIDNYPESFPKSGDMILALRSDSDGYTLFINGVNQGKRPASYANLYTYDRWYASGDIKVYESAEYTVGLSDLEIKALTLSMGARQSIPVYQTPSNTEEGVWTYEASPVLTGSLTWELTSIAAGDPSDSEPNVYEFCSIQLSSNSFIASYTGGWSKPAIGIARSTDGVSWTKDGDPKVGNGVTNTGTGVTTTYGGHNGPAARSCLVKEGSNYHIYFSDSTAGGNIKRVTSTDNGATFGSLVTILDKNTQSPTDFTGFANTHVMKDGSTWRMWVESFRTDFSSWNIFYTTSTDGVTWNTLQGPLTALSRGGMFGGPCVAKVGSSYEIYYHAALSGLAPTNLYHARTSTPDTISSWVQIPNPVFYLGEQASPISGADQLGDLSILFLLDGTTRAFFEQVKNATPENNILSATLPFQPTV